jgi:hypothetical protein
VSKKKLETVQVSQASAEIGRVAGRGMAAGAEDSGDLKFELYRKDVKPLPPAASGRDFADKTQQVAWPLAWPNSACCVSIRGGSVLPVGTIGRKERQKLKVKTFPFCL